MSADPQRVVRLIGDGTDTSGGLPLPDAFTAVTEEILDHGPVPEADLVKVVADALHFKERRVMETAWRSWEDFTSDIVCQLRDAAVIRETPDGWEVVPEFQLGRRYVVIPAKDIGVRVFDRETRVTLNDKARLRLEIRRLHADTRMVAQRHQHADAAAVRVLRQAARVLGEADALLGKYLDEDGRGDAAGRVRGESTPLADRPRRPTARELAEFKYGLGGGPVRKGARGFGPDGLRECTRCRKRRPPEDFEVYWESGHNEDYFLQGRCRVCRSKKGRVLAALDTVRYDNLPDSGW